MNSSEPNAIHEDDTAEHEYFKWRIDAYLSAQNKNEGSLIGFNRYLRQQGKPQRTINRKTISKDNLVRAISQLSESDAVFICRCPTCNRIMTARFCEWCREYTLEKQPLEYESQDQAESFLSIIMPLIESVII